MKRPTSSKPSRTLLAEWFGMGILIAFTLSAILGYWVFALHPNLIPDTDSARRFYGLSFKLFARAHIVVSAIVLFYFLLRNAGRKWVLGFMAIITASFLSEHIGTGYGFPFGGYEYTNLLGYKLGGRVPLVIPLSWFLMALPSWVLAHRVFPGREGRVGRMFLAAYLLTAWDLALDPAMSFLTPYWVWENPGPYFGMPWVNLAGWMGTGLVLMGILEALGARRWAGGLSVRWMATYYGVVLFMPLGMLAAGGHWVAIAVTGIALLLPSMALLARRSSTSTANAGRLAEGRAG